MVLINCLFFIVMSISIVFLILVIEVVFVVVVYSWYYIFVENYDDVLIEFLSKLNFINKLYYVEL